MNPENEYGNRHINVENSEKQTTQIQSYLFTYCL